MSDFKIYWYDDDHSIIVWEFPKHYAVQDIIEAQKQGAVLRGETNAERIDQILDLNRSQLPNLSGMVSGFVKDFEGLQENVHLIVFVNPSFFAERMLDIIKNLSHRAKETMRFAKTLEEAVEIIQQERDNPAGTP